MPSFLSQGGASGVLLPRARGPQRERAIPPGWPPQDTDDRGGGGGGGGDGGERGGPEGEDSGARVLALALALTGIGTLFLVLIAVWLLLRRNEPGWNLSAPRSALDLLLLSTTLLVASSATLELAARRAADARRSRVLPWMVLSLTLGLGFLGAQFSLWWSLWQSGNVPASSGYAAVFFALTGLHALHVAGGLVFLGAATVEAAGAARRSSTPDSNRPRQRSTVRLGAIYWHFMGAIWLVLFTLLYFVR